MTETTSRRAQPYHCPFCAEEDLRPHGVELDAWECRACLRAFRLNFLGMVRPSDFSTSGPESANESENPS